MPKKEKSTFSHFFKEDAKNVKDILGGGTNQQIRDSIGFTDKEAFPKLNTPKEVTPDAFKAHWRKLRSFFRNSDNKKGLSADFWPVIMSPKQSGTMIGVDYPLWVANGNFAEETVYCLSLKELITATLNEIGPEDEDMPILKNNIERILHIANDQLVNKKPLLFPLAIKLILDELARQLAVTGKEGQVFERNLKHFREALPKKGVLLPYSESIPFQLLEVAIQVTQERARKTLKQDVRVLKSKLEDLLRVDREKGPERLDPEKLQDSLSFVDSMVKFNELSSILPETGSVMLGEKRSHRIRKALKELEEGERILDQQGYIFIDHNLFEKEYVDWGNLFEKAIIGVFEKSKGCETLKSTFVQQISTCTKLFIAKRIGELELENKYQEEVHDEYFKHFNWQSFSQEELNNCPYFIMIADEAQFFDTEFNQLSALLSDNFPVKIVAVKREDYVSHNRITEKKEKSLHTQAELSALMLSYRNIYVSQSTSVTPKYLFESFQQGLTAFAPAFFSILTINAHSHENPFIWASATVESRDFPGFTFKGLLGTPWGSRFELDNNPQPTLDWPVHNLKVINEDGEKSEMAFPFTFADLAVLNPAYHHHFLPVDTSFWSEDLIPLVTYIRNSTEENIGKIPFIWMLDGADELHKVAVSWPVVLATQERLDFWRFLQENSGINNYHVAQAVEQIKAEMKAVHEFEIKELKKEQGLEIQKVRDEEAEKVMENLTTVLLDLDTSNVLETRAKVPKAPIVSQFADEQEDAKPEETPEKVEAEEFIISDDPYIDTVLCTTCHECINLNGAMFKYNADKMAYIADARAGTFKDLVEAAEKCPVGIIHPGSPLNPDEPGLESLIKRAEKFN